jgi:hypothetical protein
VRLALAFVVPALLLSVAPARAAEPGKLDIGWQAPPGCPAFSDVESWLQAVIPPDARERLAELHVKVSISGSTGAGYSANVRVTRDGSPAGETRVVEGRACEEVARSALVVVSVAMSDALKVEAPQAPPSEPERAAPTPIPAPPPPPIATATVTAAKPADGPAPRAATLPIRWLLIGAVGAGSGFAKQPGIRVDLGLLYALGPHVLIGPRVHALPSVTVRREDDVAKLHFVAGGLELCWLPQVAESVRVGACARGEAGMAWARGSVDGSASDSGPVAALALTPSASFGQRVRFIVAGDVELRVLRPRFETADNEVLSGLPLVAGSGLLGLALALP